MDNVWLLLGFFALCAAVVWIAGIYVSNATDVLAERFRIGEALGGAILLAIVTNLPEIAIVSAAAVQHQFDLAIGNVLGGIAIQTVVLVLLDAVGVRRSATLTYVSASLSLVLEGLLVIAVLTLTIIGHQLPPTLIFARVTPAGLLIVATWVTGLYLVNYARRYLRWNKGGDAPGGQAKTRGHARKQADQVATVKGHSTTYAALVFASGALVTLIAGVGLEVTGQAIADRIGMSGVVFGATILAAATALPEVSTGLAACQLGDYKMAVSDIFGGNAFLPVLLPFATLLSGEASLPKAKAADIYLTAVGMLLTFVYICGLILRPRRKFLRMGIDSIIVLIVYAISIAGLAVIGQK